MSETEVDELFGDGGRQARPKTTRIIAVLTTGVVLTVLGMACTAVPGGLITLVSWALVEKELDRVDAGYLALEHRPQLVLLRRLVWAGLMLVLALFFVQGFLLCFGWYGTFWTWLIELARPSFVPMDTDIPPLP
mgnify:CR=1 FL=1